MTRELDLLLLEDCDSDADLVQRQLRREGLQVSVRRVWTEPEFLAALRQRAPELILADYGLPSYDGLSALKLAQRECPEVPFLFVSGTLGEEAAIDALHQGAADCVAKHRLGRLGPAVQRALRQVEERRQRQQAEAALRQSQSNYALLFNQMIDGFALHEIICDPAGQPVDYRFRSVNPAFERLTGLKAAAVLGRTVREVLPGVGSFWIETYGRVALTGESTTFEHHDSQLGRHFQVTAFRPVPGQFACVFIDITQRKTAEAELEESRRRLLEIIEATPAGYFYIGDDGCFRHVNPAWLRMHGFAAPDEVLGAHFSTTQVETDLQAAQDLVARVLGGEHIKSGEFSRRLKDGSIGWHSFSLNPVLQEGRVIGLEGFLIDATERRRAEESIQRSEAELEAIYDSTPLMLCLINRDRQVERVNRSLAEFLGSQPAASSPHGPGDLLGCINALDDPNGCGFGPQCRGCPLRLAVIHTFETGEPCRQVEAGMLLVRGQRRREVQVSASTALVRLGDQPKVLVCLEDITSRKQLEAQFLQAQKMEAVGQLAGGVAHDFNNILAATLLHLQLLQQKQNLDPEMAASLRELEEGAQRAASLTRQLLLFSRREVIQTRRVDFNEVLQGLLKMLKRLLGESIETVFTPERQPVWVEADVGMLEQVVMNLSINARDAMPRGGQLHLAIQRLTLTPEQAGCHPPGRPGDFACLLAADTGCGMDEPTLQRVFEPFFTTKAPGHGTGLGLATVRGIVQQHRGWVEVESAAGHGTTFRVWLPVAESPVAPRPPTNLTKPQGGTETILLVEDDAQVRRMARIVLGGFGYEILEAANGAQAVQLWEQHGNRVSLLFTDMVMPGGFSGLDLAERLRQFTPGLKALISSGYALDFLQQADGLPAGMRFLAKPYDPDTLALCVRECLDAPGPAA